MTNIKSPSIDRLFEIIMNLSSVDECYALFEDLCTVKELQDMAQRFDTAVLLSEGKSYQQIAALVGTSTATISRVNRCLEYGSGGYRAAISKIKGE